MACLDTTALIDAAGVTGRRLRARARGKLGSFLEGGETLTTTRFNMAELWVGVESSRDREAELRAVEAILEPLIVLDFDERSARVFGRISAHLRARGSARGDMDVLIASVALVHGEAIVTRNTAHFADIPGLTVESY
jgi:tRNA(fMet)-specific endonuclease VapC